MAGKNRLTNPQVFGCECKSINTPRGMFCYISFVIEGHDTKFLCELCEKEIQGPEILLKLHQIGLHLNPYYLSASDRILAQISSYAVHTEKTEVPWVPDWDTFKVSFINTKIRSDCLFMDRRLKRVLIGHVICYT